MALKFGSFGRPFVKRFALCYRTIVCPVLSVLSVTLVYCGQTVGLIKMKLASQVGFGPGRIVLDEDLAPPLQKWNRAPQSSTNAYCGQTAAWIKMPLGMEVGLGDTVPPSQKGHPFFSALAYCGQTITHLSYY